MKPLRSAILFLFTCYAMTPLCAEARLPADNNREEWNLFIDMFAECSAVYNLAATLRESPEKEKTSYRDLANHALIAGLYSAQKLGLGENYLESIYSVKFRNWEKSLKDKKQAEKLLTKAEHCIVDSLPLQEQVIENLRKRKPAK